TASTGNGKNIVLDTVPNGVGSISVGNAKNASFQTSGDVALGAISIGGDLTVSAAGNITQTAALDLSGGRITAGVTAMGKDIRLDTYANVIKDGFSFASGTEANVRDFGLRNTRSDAALPTLSSLSGLRNLFVEFNGNSVALPSFNASGD